MNCKYALSIITALSLGCAIADDAEVGASEAAPNAQAAENAVQKKAAKRVSDIFTTLPFCRETSGSAEVLHPGAESWQPIEDGRFYPLGSSYRTGDNGHIVIAFGKGCFASIDGNSSFGTRVEEPGAVKRTVLLASGELDMEIPDNMPEGAFAIVAPGFVVKNPAGKSHYAHTDKGDGYETIVRCVTGTMQADGRHFAMPRLRAADEFRMRHSHDELETIVYGLSGDFVVRLDQGVSSTFEIDDNGARKEKLSPRTFDWHLSPETHVQINRAVPSVGEKMSVHTMAFDAAGNMQSECSFCEGRAELNSGELVAQEKKDPAELAKRAAAATDEAAATEEAPAEEEKSEEKKEKSEAGE